MGNHSDKVGVHATLNTTAAYPGETIAGTAYVCLREVVGPSRLLLRFIGEEHTKWTAFRGNSEQTHCGYAVCCDLRGVLCDWEQGLDPCDLSIPFTIVLPEYLSGSFEYKPGAIIASIEYVVQVIFSKNSKFVTVCEVPLRLKQRYDPSTFTVNVRDSLQAQLVSWCCFPKGMCRVSAHISQNYFTIRNSIEVTVELDNSASTLDVDATQVTVKRAIIMVSDEGKHAPLRQPILTVSGQGVLAGAGSTTIQITVDLARNSALFTDKYSTSGGIVECFYCLEVAAVTSGSCMCCGDCPAVYLPIEIMCSEDQDDELPLPPPPPPADWNPQQIEEVELGTIPPSDQVHRENASEEIIFQEENMP